MTGQQNKLLAEWFWVDRWNTSSAFELPMEAQGVYRSMLSQAWVRGAMLPNNHEAIQKVTGCSRAEWRRCWPMIQKYWIPTADGYLVNETQVGVYAQCEAKHLSAVERGKLGAKRKAKLRATGSTKSKPQDQGETPLPPLAGTQAPTSPAAGPDGPPPTSRRSDTVRTKYGPSDVDPSELEDRRTPEEKAAAKAASDELARRFGRGKESA